MVDLINQRQQKLDDLTYRAERAERQLLERTRRRWETVSATVRHYDLRLVLSGMRKELSAVTGTLAAAMRTLLLRNRVRCDRLGAALEGLSPIGDPGARLRFGFRCFGQAGSGREPSACW